MASKKDKDYEKMADAIVKKNYEYRNKWGSVICIIGGIVLLIMGIVFTVLWKEDFDTTPWYNILAMSVGGILILVGAIWLIVHYAGKSKKKTRA